jgi:acyl transferase domain-containing protein/NAD(P)H-dependent flavin oxidoreductase YrpB (nitropropane dioxygenase family)/NAD(P)-dependent dehydrogenase (short-subunit alcohol dehydrogenase family)
MSNLGIMAITSATLPGLQMDLPLVVAASRAGGIGVVDCQFAEDANAIEKCLKQLVREVSVGVGIKITLEQVSAVKSCLSILAGSKAGTTGGGRTNVVVLESSPDAKKLASAIEVIHSFNLHAFVEVIDVKQAKQAEQAAADALIAKGHESGGRVGEETTFVLLQRLAAATKLPVWAQGGIGLHTAAACYVGGAAGVVLDAQLLLTRESSLPAELKSKVARMDGSETILLGQQVGCAYRLYNRPGLKTIDELNEIVSQLETKGVASKGVGTSHSKGQAANAAFSLAVGGKVKESLQQESTSLSAFDDKPWFLGQDVAFASSFAERYVTVAGVMQAIWRAVGEHIKSAGEINILGAASPLAASHGTTYPIVQGAMTRVSDSADFAQAVATNGALPFLALALMRGKEVEQLLEATSAKLQGQAWGVGILGFIPNELRQEQMEVVTRYKPPFALIAGGRPDQAQALESLNIATYLHVPSPLLLKSFLDAGSRRFIFEGKECGGHVGPRSSFVLWESMVEVLLAALGAKEDASAYHIVFAGGIHDGISAAMVAALAAPLAARGVRVGVLMGTAYLFTEEIVKTGAIVKKFQKAALGCEETVLLETGPGHAIRCIESPYKETFESQRRKLEAEKKSKEDVRQELELMNLGRLRIASKGLTRDSKSNSGQLVSVPENEQWSDGMYMIGQVAALHKEVLTIEKLHKNVAESGTERLQKFARKEDAAVKDVSPLPNIAIVDKPGKRPQDVAIIGMSCLFPQANNLESYWTNILNKVDAIEEIPKDQWDYGPFYDQDPLAADKIYSKWGGFLKDILFDPTYYGIPPSSLASIDPMQILMLEVTRAALNDAGYGARPFPKERASVILANAGHAPITAFYSLRSMLDWKLKDLDPKLKKAIQSQLPEWTEDTFPGFLGNVAAGRVANRFDLGGVNFSVDAACASSLAALYIGLRELRAGTSDVALIAATDTHNQPGDYLSFSKVHALSPRGRCRTFDATADGIVISEGVAMIVLKRLADAERDGDRIYAVIKGMGGSSDGRDLSLTAPRPAGQVLSLARAYADAEVSPSTVGLIEAHGTGTTVGDRTELDALAQVFDHAGADRLACAVGSVKSMIGHTKAAAGLASIIKIAKALHHKILPPTIGVEKPNPSCDWVNGPFFIAAEAKPWLNASLTPRVRRAGVSAFGFGGTNFHTVLEEYVPAANFALDMPSKQLASELFAWKADARADLVKAIASFAEILKSVMAEEAGIAAVSPDDANKVPPLTRLAYTNYLRFAESKGAYTLSLVASSLSDLEEKIGKVKQILADESKRNLSDPKGIYFAQHENNSRPPKVAMLFPGQGSQKLNMLNDLSMYFGEARSAFETADGALAPFLDKPLSSYIFPPTSFSLEETKAKELALTDTHIAQPAVAAADMAAFKVLAQFGLKADMVAGHSFGEYVALWAASVFTDSELLQIAEKRGRLLAASGNGGGQAGTMAAVTAPVSQVKNVLAAMPEITLANINAPNQCIISGAEKAIEAAIKLLGANQIPAKQIAVSAAFHSPHMVAAQGELKQALSKLSLAAPSLPVYSNTDAIAYPDSGKAIVERLVQHLISPVEFVKEVDELYAAGARIFIEVGPGAVLTNLVGSILEGKEHLAVSCERSGRSSMTQLQHMLAQLISANVPVNLSRLYQGRLQTVNEIAANKQVAAGKTRQKLLYLVNGAKFQALATNSSVNSPANMKKDAMSESKSAPSTVSAMAIRDASRLPSSAAPANVIPPQAPSNVAGNGHAGEAHGSGQAGNAISGGKIDGNGYQRPVRRGAERSDMDQVMFKFQQTMAEMTASFLQTQQNVMLAYLQAKSGGRVEQIGQSLQAQNLFNPSLIGENLVNLNQTNQDLLMEAMAKLSGGQFVAPLPDGNGHSPDNGDTVYASGNNGHDAPSAPADHLPAAGGINAEELVAKFLEIVSERTGYPPEMLDLNLDMEADLGIDSIKRVEILSTFRKLLPEETQQQMEGSVEKLAGTKTLQAIIDWIRAFIGETTAGNSSASGNGHSANALNAKASVSGKTSGKVEDAKTKAKTEEGMIVSRAVVQLKELPTLAAGQFACHGVVVITDDEGGAAKEILQAAKKNKQKAVILEHAAKAGPAKAGYYQADLMNLASVQEVLKLITDEHGTVSGLIHLASFAEAGKFAKAKAGEAKDVRSLFVLAKALEPTFKQNPKQAFVIAGTGLGGDFASISKPDNDLYVQQAGVVGVIKSLAKEWPDVTVKVVDFARDAQAATIAKTILNEAFAGDTEVEVGYFNQKRIALAVKDSPLADGHTNGNGNGKVGHNVVAIDSSSVILITGGARGITADLAYEIAGKHKSKLIVVGRSPRPDGAEAKQLQGITNARELKAAIMEMLKNEGKAISIGAVESVYQKLLRDREITANLAKIESTGASVHYFAVDVTDSVAFTGLIDNIYEMFGKIDGVIHGAGVIEDNYIKDKDLASFERVFFTKVTSATTLSQKLRLSDLKFLVLMSSVVGRTGNAGQTDYVAANEVVNKLARVLQQKTEARVTSIMWGPWNGGMARPELESIFASYGWSMINPAAGCAAFDAELMLGHKDDVEVLLVGLLGKTANQPDKSAEGNGHNGNGNGNGHGNGHAALPPGTLAHGARMHNSFLVASHAGKSEFQANVGPAFDLYLNDHTFDSVPVMPMAFSLEMMLEAAKQVYPDWHLVRLHKLDIPAGIVFDTDSKLLSVIVAEESRTDTTLLAKLSVNTGTAAKRAHFRVTAEFSKSANVALPSIPFFAAVDQIADPVMHLPTVADAYRDWLFHGPAFQGIETISAIGSNGIVGSIRQSNPKDVLASVNGENWLLDPIFFDSAMQLAGIWARKFLDMTCIPTGFRQLHFFAPIKSNKCQVRVFIPEETRENILRCDMAIWNEDGTPVLWVEDLGGIGSKSLNRLADQPKVLRTSR